MTHITDTEHQIERALLEAIVGRPSAPFLSEYRWAIGWGTSPLRMSHFLGVAYGEFYIDDDGEARFWSEWWNDGFFKRRAGWIIRDCDNVLWPPTSFDEVVYRLKNDWYLREKHGIRG